MSEPTIYKPSIYNGNGVYKNGAAGGWPQTTPNGLVILDWIKMYANDNSSLNFNVNIDSDLDLEIFSKVRRDNIGGYSPNAFWGKQTNGNASMSCYLTADSYGAVKIFATNRNNYSETNVCSISNAVNKIIEFTLKNDAIYHNGVAYHGVPFVEESLKTINFGSFGRDHLYLYEFTLSKNGVIYLDVIPVMDKYGNVGLYDKITNTSVLDMANQFKGGFDIN